MRCKESKRNEFFRSIEKLSTDFAKKKGWPDYKHADEFAMSVALFPTQVIQEAKTVYVTVEYRGQITYGQCVVDWNNCMEREANVKLILKLNGKFAVDEVNKMSLRE